MFIGLDVGGTTMKAGVVDDNGVALAPSVCRRKPPRDRSSAWNRCATRSAERRPRPTSRCEHRGHRRGDARLDGHPGRRHPDPPNLKPWRNVPVRQHIHEMFGMPTAFQNDANAAAYGEFWAGAGRDAHSLVLFTLGTGIGGGIIVAGDALHPRRRTQPRRRARPHQDRDDTAAAVRLRPLGLPGGLRQRHRRANSAPGSACRGRRSFLAARRFTSRATS